MSASSNNSNNNVEVYNRDLEYLPENILNAGKLEDAEQARRIADVEGENHKRVLASNLSQQFDDSLRATWFQRGSSFVLSLLNSVQKVVVNKASDITTAVSNKAGDLGQQASSSFQNKAGQVGLQVQETAHAVSDNITIKANEIGLQAAGKAQDLSASLAQKAGEVGLQAQTAALNATNKGLETAQDVAQGLKEKGLERAHSASSLAQGKAQDLKLKGLEAVQSSKSFLADKFSEYSQKLSDAVSNMALYKKFGSLIGHTNMTFAMLEEEAERAYRMNSSSEKHAIANALKVSSLIKEHFGLTSTTTDLHFSTNLLEEAERSRRIAEAQNDKAAVDNARSVSLLISQKFNVQPASQLMEIKIEQAGEVQAQKPFAAAM